MILKHKFINIFYIIQHFIHIKVFLPFLITIIHHSYDKNIIIRKLMTMILGQFKKNDANIAERKIKLENKTKETVGIKGDA